MLFCLLCSQLMFVLGADYYIMICIALYSFQNIPVSSASYDTPKDPLKEARTVFLALFCRGDN